MEYKVIEQETPDLPQSVYDPTLFYPHLITEAISTNPQKILFGAFDSGRLIGMAIAHSEYRQRKNVLQSDLIIVHPDYQSQGIGFAIKQLQRSWALSRKIPIITWSFNPLQSQLAKFYFHRLGVVSTAYATAIEGVSDQIQVTWRLKDNRVKKLAAGISMETHSQNTPLILVSQNNKPVVFPLSEEDTLVRAQVPPDNLPQTEKTGWGLALRVLLTQAFLKQYIIMDFVVDNQQYYYVLTAPTAWFLYVLECRDGSYYTGITPDPERRLRLHNIGRGAHYTAARIPVHFVAVWKCADRRNAMQAEVKFKQLSRTQKTIYIASKADLWGMTYIGL